MTDWWMGTVVFAFLPIIISMLIDFLRNAGIDFQRLVGSGEFILSSFSVTIPSLIDYYKKSKQGNNLLYYLTLIAAILQMVAYTTIKTNLENIPYVVYWTSAICVLSTIFVAWKSEKSFKEDAK